MSVPCIVLYKGKRFTKDQFMNELMKGELDKYLGKEFPKVEQPLKPQPDAIQKPGAAESVLRQERSEMGLQEVVQGDQTKAPAGQVTPEAEVTPPAIGEREAKKQQIRDEIAQLSKEVMRKSGLAMGVPGTAIPEITQIVGKYFQLGMMNIEDIARDLVERGYTRMLPNLQRAYNDFIKSKEGKVYNMPEAGQFDYDTMIKEATEKAKAEAKVTLEDSQKKLLDVIQQAEGYTSKAPPVSEQAPKPGIIRRATGAVLGLPGMVQERLLGQYVRKAKDSMKRSFEDKMTKPDISAGTGLILDAINSLARPTSPERFKARAEKLYGPMESGKATAGKILNRVHELFGIDRDQAEVVHKVMDPEFYKVKSRKEFEEGLASSMGQENLDALKEADPDYITNAYLEYQMEIQAKGGEKLPTYNDLTENQKKYYDVMRTAGDAVHAANMLSNLMHYDTYTINKGKYVPRMYEAIERRQEVARAGGKKQETDIFKLREAVDEWKMIERITDPSYLMAKRFQQAAKNKAIYDYSVWVKENMPGKYFYSPTTRKNVPPNYVRLGDGYGELSNHYVPLTIAEDFQGFQYINDYVQKTYDIFKAYDNLAPRKFYKQLFTVFNPATQTGNIVSNMQFALLMNIDPVNYVNNKAWAIKEMRSFGTDYKYLLDKGLLRTSLTHEDYVAALNEYNAEIDNASQDKGAIKRMTEYISKKTNILKKIYEGEDDTAKMAAWKSLVEQGKSKDEAIDMVSKGMQNMQRMPKVYDFAARTPVIASPFARFKADLGRIMLTNATERPLTMAAYLYALSSTANILSKMYGETDDEKEIREGRTGAPKIPLLDIPLTWKVGNSELNVARYLFPLYTFEGYSDNDFANAVNKITPFDYTPAPQDTRHPQGSRAAWLGMINKDPLTQVLNVWSDADFRGQSVWQPEATKYTGYTASTGEKIKNSMRYLTASYVPYGRDGMALYDALMMYADPELKQKAVEQGKQVQTVGQALLRIFPGAKIQQVPDERYKKMLQMQVNNLANEFDLEAQKLSTIRKQYEKGGPDQDEAEVRILEVIENLNEINSRILEFNAQFDEKKYQDLRDDLFLDFEGYDDAVRKFDRAKESPSDFLETPARPPKKRRRGFGSGLSGGLKGGISEGF